MPVQGVNPNARPAEFEKTITNNINYALRLAERQNASRLNQRTNLVQASGGRTPQGNRSYLRTAGRVGAGVGLVAGGAAAGHYAGRALSRSSLANTTGKNRNTQRSTTRGGHAGRSGASPGTRPGTRSADLRSANRSSSKVKTRNQGGRNKKTNWVKDSNGRFAGSR